MKRAITPRTLILLLFLYSLKLIDGANTANSAATIGEKPSLLLARHRKLTKLTTKTPLPNKTMLIVPTVATPANSSPMDDVKAEPRCEYFHPAEVQKPRLIEHFEKRALDGQFEHRYVLSNGDVRYERAYWLPVGNGKVLARKGFYSYPLPNKRFHTVFYTADHNGYRADESSYTRTQPVLPLSLHVPIVSEVSIEKNQEHKIKRKSNWIPTTKSILQKGNNDAIVHETGTGIETIKTTTATMSATMSTTTKAHLKTSSTLSATNRPQINIKVEKPAAIAAIATGTVIAPATTTTATTELTATVNGKGKVIATATDTATATATENANAIRVSSGMTNAPLPTPQSETINRIKIESVQTTAAAIVTDTEKVETVDTTTILSVD